MRRTQFLQTLAIVAGCAVAVVGLGWTAIVVPQHVIPAYSDKQLSSVTDPAKSLELRDSRIKLQNDLRGSLLQLIGGLALATGLVLTYRQLKINRDGQLTDRFTAAITHLGQDDNLSVTLGGIQALERIARDSRSDRGAIQEILAAYVRDHSPWPPKASQPGENEPLSNLPRLAARLPAVQAALTVLGRMPRPLDADHPLDLRRTDLRRADLHSANLQFADLEEAHLERAWLRGADLRNAKLWGTNLTDAKLHEAKTSGVVGADTIVWPADFDPVTGLHAP